MEKWLKRLFHEVSHHCSEEYYQLHCKPYNIPCSQERCPRYLKLVNGLEKTFEKIAAAESEVLAE